MTGFAEFYLTLGPLLIVLIAIALTILGGNSRNSQTKWFSLYLVPITSLLLIYVSLFAVTHFLKPVEGSGFLLGGSIFVIFVFLLFYIYYPILLIYSLISYFKFRRSKKVIN